MRVKMLDLTREYKIHRDEYMKAVNGVFDRGSFILGEYVSNFESMLAEYTGAKHAIGVANGTDAILLSLLASGIKPGDEVITTPFTFIATAETIVLAGAVPVFADIDPATFNISPESVKELITEKTRAVLPVHLYGNPADMDSIMSIAENRGLSVIEDCAQSLGANYRGRMTGTFGDAGTVSFFPTKNLGCAGDGGAIITNRDEVAEKARKLRVHGAEKKYVHSYIGFNSRLDSLQAALLSVKLPKLDEKNAARKRIAEIYNSRIKAHGVVKPALTPYGEHIYHQYTLLCSERDELKSFLAEKGVDSTIYYPVPLHRQKAFEKYSAGVNLPNAESAAAGVLSLPIYPELKDEEAEYAADQINSFYA